jgi:hypothetical protein
VDFKAIQDQQPVSFDAGLPNLLNKKKLDRKTTIPNRYVRSIHTFIIASLQKALFRTACSAPGEPNDGFQTYCDTGSPGTPANTMSGGSLLDIADAVRNTEALSPCHFGNTKSEIK